MGKRKILKQEEEIITVRNYIGFDNGVSGSIGIISSCTTNKQFFLTPTFSSQDYTKKKKNISRVDSNQLKTILAKIDNPFAILERPMVNPGRFAATASALRCLEATLIILELLTIPYIFIDSKEWQKEMLPKGIKGAPNLKKASLDIGIRLFPEFKNLFKGDADGILIAEWARRNNK